MNITNIQSAIAPILAPIAPAVLFGNNLHAGMIGDGVNPTLAIVASVLGTGGVELSGALACSMAVMAYHKRDYRIMWVSIIAAVVYAVFVMVGILQARNTATFAGAVIISLVAYLMQGVWQSYTNKLRTEQAETTMQISLINAEKNKINAETRKAKINGFVHANDTQTGQAIARLSDEKIAVIREYWTTHPGAKYRDVAAAVGCAPSTAMKYKPEETK